MDDTKREWIQSWLIKAHSDFVLKQVPPEAHPPNAI